MASTGGTASSPGATPARPYWPGRAIRKRRAQQIITTGDPDYWVHQGEQLRLVGLPKIAARLGVGSKYQFHRVPVSELRTRAGMTATALNLALPLDDRPVTRERKAYVSGVSERHQRRIDVSDDGSELIEEVYAHVKGQWPHGGGYFIDHSGRQMRRIADVRVARSHTLAPRSRATNARRRTLRRTLTNKAVPATESERRFRTFKGCRRRDAARHWTRAGRPEGMLVFFENRRERRKLVGQYTSGFT